MPNEHACYAVVVEGKAEGPIVMEAEGDSTSYEDATRRLKSLLAGHRWIRGCVVHLEFAVGNSAVLDAMEAMQRVPDDSDAPASGGFIF